METAWFCLIVLVAAIYGVLDGYDLGVGILLPFVGRSHQEREIARQTILPVWDGNEVWLIAGGAILFFTFPRAYAASFGGFYLAFFVLLWLLVPRALALELRGHSTSPLWRDFCDAWFFGSSLALGLVFGVALGNVLRGVPLRPDGYFFVPFWTTFLVPQAHPGVFDWYTVLTGLSAVSILIIHGAAFLAMRSSGSVRDRALRIARRWTIVALLLPAGAAAVTPLVNRGLLLNYHNHAACWLAPASAGLSALAMAYFAWRGKETPTFVSSTLLIVLLVTSAAIGTYPSLLISTTDRRLDLTIYNAATTHDALMAGFIWGGIGLVIAAIYSIATHWIFRFRITPQTPIHH